MVELDSNAIEILSRIVKREKYESGSDAIRHLENQCVLQKAVIHQQENEVQKLEEGKGVSIRFDEHNDIIDDSPQAHYLITGKKSNIELNLKALIPEWAYDEFLTELEAKGHIILLWRNVLIPLKKDD